MKDSADKLTKIYIKMRNAIREKEDEIKTIKKQQETVVEKLLALCEEQDLDSLRTSSGTVSRRVQSHYWTSDWERMYDFLKEHDAFHLLEKRISGLAMKQFLEDNPDLMPAGLQVNRKYIVSVLKPRKK
jgi:hypothetical protein